MEEQNNTATTHTAAETSTGEASTIASASAEAPVTKKFRISKQIIIAISIVILGGVAAGGYYLYTTQYSPVAVVNGLKIARKEFNESVTMITQTASLQGADVTDPNIQKEINTQALEILVSNTLLLEA